MTVDYKAGPGSDVSFWHRHVLVYCYTAIPGQCDPSALILILSVLYCCNLLFAQSDSSHE